MDRRRVTELWNWLPAFRAVAETQHLPTASRQLHLSASALSRAVRLLEDEIGRPLFERHGRQLVLSAPGETLLAAVRDAMRALEAGVNAITTTAFEGPVKISAPGPYATVFVLPALSRVRAEYPKIVPHVTSLSSSEVNSKLIAGEIDLAVIDDPTVDEHVTVYCLGELTFGVYCGESHPLAEVESVDLASVIEHPFVGPPPDLMDHWPKHVVRRLGMIATQMHVAVQACATGDFLVMLPDPIARAYRGESALVRLPLELVAPSTLYAVTSKLPDDSSRVELVLDAIGREVREKGRAAPKASYIGELACDSEPAPPRSEGRVSRDSCVPAAKDAC